MTTITKLYSGIGEKNSIKGLARPGYKSSIVLGNETVKKTVPKNAASSKKAQDLISNPLGLGPPDNMAPKWAAQDNQQAGFPPQGPHGQVAPWAPLFSILVIQGVYCS